jgi:hypothetical protein
MRPDRSYKNRAINSEAGTPVCFVDRIDAHWGHFATPASRFFGLRSLCLSEFDLNVADNGADQGHRLTFNQLVAGDLKITGRPGGDGGGRVVRIQPVLGMMPVPLPHP